MVKYQQRHLVGRRSTVSFLSPITPGRRPATRALKAAKSRMLASGAAKFKRGMAATTMLGRRKQNMTKQIVRAQQGGLPSFSKFQLTNKPNKTLLAMKRVSAPNYRVTNGANQIVNLEGFQNAGVYTWLGRADMVSLLSYVPGAGGVYPNAPKRLHVESIVNELLMTNSSLATQYVDIYDIVRKRDAGYSTSGQGGDSPTSNPYEAWRYGVSDQTSTSPDLTAWTNVSSLPTDSKLFNDYFRVIKRSHIGLVAGATHRHSVILKTNRIIDSALVGRCSGDLAGYAVYTMVVINGQPASIKTEEGAVVTTATTALDVVNSRRFKYSYVQDNTVIWNVTDNLSTLTGEVITQPSLGNFVSNSIA